MAVKAERSPIGARLEEFAVARFENISGLARAMGIGRSQLGHYLTGKFGIPMKQMERLAELGLNVDWLIYGRGQMDAPTETGGGLQEIEMSDQIMERLREALLREALEKENRGRDTQKTGS